MYYITVFKRDSGDIYEFIYKDNIFSKKEDANKVCEYLNKKNKDYEYEVYDLYVDRLNVSAYEDKSYKI